VGFLLHFFRTFFHEVLFLAAGIVIGVTIMFVVFDRYDRRRLDRHARQVEGLLGRISELALKNRRASDPHSERPPA
jgi:uncharacterized membrane protein YccC